MTAAEPTRTKHARWTPTQYREALTMRRCGALLQSIGDHFGVNAERARQVLDKAERLERKGQL